MVPGPDSQLWQFPEMVYEELQEVPEFTVRNFGAVDESVVQQFELVEVIPSLSKSSVQT